MSEPQNSKTPGQCSAPIFWQPQHVFLIAAVISLALVSWLSFLWLGSSSLYYLAAWLGIHAYFFGVLEIKLKAQQDAPILNLYQQAKALLLGQAQAAPPSDSDADKEEALRLSHSLESALLEREDAEQRDTAPSSADRDPPLAGPDTADNDADDWDVGIADESDDGADSYDAAAEIDAQLAAADSSEAQHPRQRRVSVPDSSPARHELTAEQQAAALLQTPDASAEAQLQQQVFQWEMGGRSQLLRRNTSQFITEEAEMVQELLESVSDAPTEASSEWRLVRDRRGARVWTSAVADSPWYRIRGRVRCVGATPAQLLALLIDDHRVSEYDRMFEQLREVQRLDDHTNVRWSAYKAVWPTRPRDFVIKSTWEEFADGTVVIATRSVDHPDCPETPTYVRGRMIMCGYVITPRDGGSSGSVGGGTHSSSSSVALRPSPRQRLPSNAGLGAGRRGSAMSFGEGSDSDDDSCDESEDAEGCDLILYTHTDLGGALPASIINRLCKKPAYRVLRQVQKMAAAGTLVSSSHGGNGSSNSGSAAKSGSGGLFVPAGLCMDRTNSEDVLQSLIDDGELENSDGQLLGEALDHIGEESDSGADPAHRRRSYVNGNSSSSAVRPSRRHSSPVAVAAAAAVPAAQRKTISLAYAAAEARRIMALLERMASQRSGWVQLGPARVAGASSDTADMGLYKWPLPGTRRVRLGASATVRAAPEELLGLLLDSAAMLGPDYVVDGQQSIQTLSSSTGEGGSSSAGSSSSGAAGAQQDDTAIYWFSCTHRRQRIRRDFVILRCFHRLEGGGGLIAYATVDHPAYPPTAAFVRGKIDMCGFVVLPQKADEDDEQQQQDAAVADGSDSSDAPAAAATGSSSASTAAAAAAPPSVATSDTALQQLAASEVYFYTHLSFSEHLPALEDNARASRHLVGPLHILQELRRVVDRTLEYGASARGGAGGSSSGGGRSRDRSRGGSSSTGRRDSMREAAVSSEDCADCPLQSAAEESSAERDCTASGKAHESSGTVSTLGDSSAGLNAGHNQQQHSGEGSSSSSAALVPSSGVNSTAASRITAQREAALRDLLTLASDGESMDGPRVAWQLVRDGGESGVKLWKCALPGSAWSMIRTRTRLAASPSTVLDLLLDDSRIGEYDDLFDKIRVVEAVDEQAAFKRTVYKPVWPTAPRDFSLLCSWGRLEDGSAYLVNRSVAHPDCPEVKGFVRGIVMMCGFLMVPTAPANSSSTNCGTTANSGDNSSSATAVAEPQSCTLTMVVHSELGGNLPVGIVNKISTGAPAMVSAKLQKLFAGPKARTSKQ
jgi:START domain